MSAAGSEGPDGTRGTGEAGGGLAQCRRILEYAAEGFFLMDPELRITEVNQALLRLLGRGRDELVGRHPWEFFDETTQAFLERKRREFVRRERRHFRAVFVRPDGAAVPVMIHGAQLRDEAGRLVGQFVFVTDLREEERALAMAQEVQQRLLPREAPRLEGVELAGCCVPSHGVGGDYYDFLLPVGARDRLQVLLGDVAGHGLEAALLMASVRGMVRMRATRPGAPLDVVRDLNRMLCQDMGASGRFMTLLLCCLDLGAGEIRWVRAGQDPGLLRQAATGRIVRLGGRGVPLGVDPDADFEESRLPFAPGDCLCLASDGLREARGGADGGGMFGWERMEAVLDAHASGPPEELLRAMCGAMRSFTRNMPQEDDVTLVVARCTREPSRRDGLCGNLHD
ncbi:putative PAS/PAC sensor protein [Desulfovibrio sp. X2]|uniref:PP2C family protein-serine/threonine phosphatase n=1 Tax=Desulfovibrio sp. X2 TaxID=941449 RepID=UPI000358D002|nr:SpoIIE family protein phosphatase [Desulfovibrio sp. X2]EPR43520.1 putative PAS/PAC sensor protein [Desulfovibrio sp. X2]